MTEKRFTHQRTDDYNFSDILDNGKWIGICHVDCEDDFVDKLNELHEENKELKERNNRQAKQLDNLYTLIEKQDWKTLKGIIQEFQECEEQLQREWKCYE